MKRPKLRMLAIPVLAGLALTACTASPSPSGDPSSPAGSSSPGGGSGTEKPVIGISVKTITNDPFQAAWVKAAQEKVEALGGEAQVLTAGGQTAIANQVSQLNDLVAKQVDGIIVSPLDGSAVVPALKNAKEAGVPVIIVDQPIAAGNDDLYETLIATDNVEAGKQLASYLVSNIGKPNPKVAIIEGAPGSVAGDDRKKGFLEGLQAGGVTPVASASGEWSNDKALTAMENILTAHGDLDAVLSASDVMVDGILQALAGGGRTDVKVLAIDGSKRGVQGVIDGELMADNTQNPIRMGELAAENLIGIAKGEVKSGSLPKYVDSGTQTVTSENAQEALKTAF
ncbi:MAG: sugar ABC transporter substrate-binding protein [Propionicimonas sp.]